MPTLLTGAGGLMAVAGEMRGKALKLKGNAESGESRGGESLDAEDETRAGWTVVAAAAVVGGPRRGPCSECGVALPLRLPEAWASAMDEDGEEAEELEAVEVDDRGVWGLLLLALWGKWCCWCWRSRGWLRWAAGDPKAEPQAR